MSRPPTNVCPDVGRSRPAMQCMSVDLPEPDGPSADTRSFSGSAPGVPEHLEPPSHAPGAQRPTGRFTG